MVVSPCLHKSKVNCANNEKCTTKSSYSILFGGCTQLLITNGLQKNIPIFFQIQEFSFNFFYS